MAPLRDRGEGLERLRRVDQVFEVAGEDARLLDGLEHPPRLGGRAAERLGAQDGLARRGRADGFLVQIVGQADDDDVGLGVLDGSFQVGGGLGDAPAAAKAMARSWLRE